MLTRSTLSLTKSQLLCSKGDLVSLQYRVKITDLVETCAQERAQTKWRYALARNVTIFCTPLKKIQIDCLAALIPKQLSRRTDLNGFSRIDKEKHTRTTIACLEQWLSTCTDRLIQKQR